MIRSQIPTWKALEAQALLSQPETEEKPWAFVQAMGIALDYAHQSIDVKTMQLLLDLAENCSLKPRIEALFQGEKVNQSQNLPALHTALRRSLDAPLWVDGKNIMLDVQKSLHDLRRYSHALRCGDWLGFSGKKITDLVNIGMGGSDLGPRFCIDALDAYCTPSFDYHFISDADPHSFDKVVRRLNPETTLFIVSSKSFRTKETLYNMKKALAFIGNKDAFEKHFIAITAEESRAYDFGFQHVLRIWDWVGGRYSVCSAINLITVIAIGFDAFSLLLEGAKGMDKHYQSTPFAQNMPVLLALVGIWNANFLHINNLLLLIYASGLNQFVDYIQQLDMESNGKSIDCAGKLLPYTTGPIIWGGNGNQAQHSYFQLLCQGTQKTAIDFISVNTLDKHLINEMCFHKKQTLTQGFFDRENPNAFIAGHLPLNHLRLETLDPKTVGALIALYEHKIYTQSVIWHINPFDQPGVESAKRAPLAAAEGVRS